MRAVEFFLISLIIQTKAETDKDAEVLIAERGYNNLSVSSSTTERRSKPVKHFGSITFKQTTLNSKKKNQEVNDNIVERIHVNRWYDPDKRVIAGTVFNDKNWIVLENFLIICDKQKRVDGEINDYCTDCEAVMNNGKSELDPSKSTWYCYDRMFRFLPQKDYIVYIKPYGKQSHSAHL